MSKDIKFETGLLKVTDDSISLQWEGNNVSMFRWQIGKVNVNTSKELKHDTLIYGFRLAAISIGLMILTFVFESNMFSWLSLISMISALIIVFGSLILPLFGLYTIDYILLNIIGREYTIAKVHNTSGQDIEFYILPEEKVKAKSISDLRIEKKPNEGKSKNDDTVSQLEQLHSLKEKGIITEVDFEKKKNQLLGI